MINVHHSCLTLRQNLERQVVLPVNCDGTLWYRFLPHAQFYLDFSYYLIQLRSDITGMFPPSGVTTRQFVGHTKDVLSVAFSADNRQIVSGSRDKTIKLWNTLGVCKYTIQVSCQLAP